MDTHGGLYNLFFIEPTIRYMKAHPKPASAAVCLWWQTEARGVPITHMNDMAGQRAESRRHTTPASQNERQCRICRGSIIHGMRLAARLYAAMHHPIAAMHHPIDAMHRPIAAIS